MKRQNETPMQETIAVLMPQLGQKALIWMCIPPTYHHQLYTKRIKKQPKIKTANLRNKILRNKYKENVSKNVKVVEKPPNVQSKWKPI